MCFPYMSAEAGFVAEGKSVALRIGAGIGTGVFVHVFARLRYVSCFWGEGGAVSRRAYVKSDLRLKI
jgi:hypothetical protein